MDYYLQRKIRGRNFRFRWDSQLFPTSIMGSVDPPPLPRPPGVGNVLIRDPLQPFLNP